MRGHTAFQKGQLSGDIIPEKTPENVAAVAAVKSKAKHDPTCVEAQDQVSGKNMWFNIHLPDTEPLKEKLVA